MCEKINKKMTTKKRSTLELIKLSSYVIAYKLFIFFIISFIFVMLYSWANIIKFDYKYIVVSSLTMLMLWLMFGKYFIKEERK